jgi:hypothetical protein
LPVVVVVVVLLVVVIHRMRVQLQMEEITIMPVDMVLIMVVPTDRVDQDQVLMVDQVEVSQEMVRQRMPTRVDPS